MVFGAGSVLAGGFFLVSCGQLPLQTSILMVTLDTTRADRIGCYGYDKAQTPALDALAEDGILFERAYTTVPLTLPAHASMMTGRFPPEHGVRVNGTMTLPPGVPVIAERFRDAGYETGATVAAFVLDSQYGLDRGFDHYDDDMSGAAETVLALHQYRNGKLVVDKALDWLKGRTAGKPFFCWVHLYDPHAPTHPHRDLFADTFVDRPYDGEIAFVDRQVKRLVDWLRDTGRYDETLIVVVGDHGEGLGEHRERTHGYMVYNTTVHVPLILKMPQALRAGRRIDSPVSLVSIAPTLLEVAELEGAFPWYTKSLSSGWRGEIVEDQVCYAETLSPFLDHEWSPLDCLITRDWKYIKSTRPELFRLVDDPCERVDLSEEEPGQLRRIADALADVVDVLDVVEGGQADLTETQRNVLETLGYAAGGNAPSAVPPPDVELPDIKDKIGFINRIEEAHDLLHGGNKEKAFALFQAVLDEEALSMYRKQYAKLLSLDGRNEQAISVLQPLYDRNPGNLAVAIEMGKFNQYLKHNKEARRIYQACREAHPQALEPRINLLVLAAEEKSWDQAIALGAEALALDNDSVDLHRNLAVMHEQRNDLDKAVIHWENVLRVDPLNKLAYEKVYWIKSQPGYSESN